MSRTDPDPTVTPPQDDVLARRPARGQAGDVPRRLVVGALTAPALFLLLLGAGGGWAPTEPVWTALVGGAALVGATTLASYVPLRGEGVRSTLGCSPCAAASALTVLGAAFVLGSGPHQASMAVVALGLVAFGLYQRRTGTGTSCPG